MIFKLGDSSHYRIFIQRTLKMFNFLLLVITHFTAHVRTPYNFTLGFLIKSTLTFTRGTRGPWDEGCHVR